jgi:hypothetical protein
MGDWLRRGWNDLVLSFDARRQQQLLTPFGLDDLGPQLVAGFVVAAMLAWRGWPGCWPAASASATRCCAPGTGSDGATPAWPGTARNRTGLGTAGTRQRPDPALLALSQRFADARYAGTCTDLASLLRDLRRHRPTSGASP